MKTCRWDFISENRAGFGVQRICRVLDPQQAVRCLPLPQGDHAPHTKKSLFIEQGLPLPQRTKMAADSQPGWIQLRRYAGWVRRLTRARAPVPPSRPAPRPSPPV